MLTLQPKPCEAIQFDGSNEGDIRDWLTSYDYDVTISITSNDVLDLYIQQLGQRIYAMKHDYVFYNVAFPFIEAIPPKGIEQRFIQPQEGQK